jgi:Subtilase family
MRAKNTKEHIRLKGYTKTEQYKYPKGFSGQSFKRKTRNQQLHGQVILQQLEALRQQFAIPEDQELSSNVVRDDAIYVEFTSEWTYPFNFHRFDQDKLNPKFQLLTIRAESRTGSEGEEEIRFQVVVMMTKGGVGNFINKVNQYLNPNEETPNGSPKHADLFNNIASLQLATLKAFWVDAPEIPFPDENEEILWEVWFRRTANDNEKMNQVLQNLQALNVQFGVSELLLPEHRIRLVRGTAAQLSASLLLLDNLAELRKPQELASFFTQDLKSQERKEWIADLVQRTENLTTSDSVLVCILDTGVNHLHPLLSPHIPSEHLYTYNEAWGKEDTGRTGGHGTAVAGLALYGDLSESLGNKSKIRLYYGLESYKVIQPETNNDPELYGYITETAISTPLVDRPFNARVFCMTITAEEQLFAGRPSAWSAAIDKIAFGSNFEPASPQLFIVSGGNAVISKTNEYPTKNYATSIHDPGQAYNAITVGAYTRKDATNKSDVRAVAPHGSMAPSNSTSITWEHHWPIKPDIVMEGGNRSSDGTYTWDDDELQLLALDKDFEEHLLQAFHSTSAATALAAKFAASLRTTYPSLWPETIRGLMIHSAEWTDAMLATHNINKEESRKKLLRSVGYGVPILEKALYSANNSLTLIAERSIQPYQKVESRITYKEYHLYELPWPKEVLQNELADLDVTLKVTLSYFIEPNPGKRQAGYAKHVQYHSHALDFRVIKPSESLAAFKRRISKPLENEEDEETQSTNFIGEPWVIGRLRSRGSVKKDFFTMSGAEMATRNIIAIFPSAGWYKTRKKEGRVDAKLRYSLVVSLETSSQEVDIYTPVENKIQTEIEVQV